MLCSTPDPRDTAVKTTKIPVSWFLTFQGETDNAQCVSFKKNYVIDNLQKVLGAKENNEIRRC